MTSSSVSGRPARRAARRGALGTMDTLLSITAGALFLIGSITIFNKAMSKSNERTIANQATLIVQSVRSFYQNQANYGDTTAWTAGVGLDTALTGADITAVLANSRQLLTEMAGGTNGTIRNAFGGTWTVIGLQDAFAVTATNVPTENCSAILSALNTSDLRQMSVVSGTARNACVENTNMSCPATPPNIVTACAGGAANGLTTIRLVYR